MTCSEAQRLIDAYVDGELDLVRTMEVEGHFDDCGSCLRLLESRQALCGAIRSAPLRFDRPRSLETRVLAAVRKESKATAARPGSRWRRYFGPAKLTFAATAVALLAFIHWVPQGLTVRPALQDRLAEEAVSSHIRSLQANHLLDVASSDQHTVKPWFNGKLDFSPPVVDIAGQGFPLVGGRLDYLGGHPVAALVYRRRLHVINVFVWPSDRAKPSAEPWTESMRGYHSLLWLRAGMTFDAVSDVNPADLNEFMRRVVERTGITAASDHYPLQK